MLFAPDRPADPPTTGEPKCQIFQWIGQAFDSCDGCGRPQWEHLYEPPFGGARPIFHVKQYVSYRKTWVWKPVGRVITRESAERCRQKWEGYSRPSA